MTTPALSIDPADLVTTLHTEGHALLDPTPFARWLGLDRAALDALRPAWHRLPPDTYLLDGGRYRRRRHGCYLVRGAEVQPVPHRAHWQPVTYNALHGGIERWFEPIEPATTTQPAWAALIARLGEVFSALRPGTPMWHVEAHQLRIDTTGGIGRPTPEGAHRDGVDFVVVILIDREGIKGGETRVFDAGGPRGLRFTMSEPWTALLLDDARVIHETTPIQPTAPGGHRDTLVLTYRARGFQGPEPEPTSSPRI